MGEVPAVGVGAISVAVSKPAPLPSVKEAELTRVVSMLELVSTSSICDVACGKVTRILPPSNVLAVGVGVVKKAIPATFSGGRDATN